MIIKNYQVFLYGGNTFEKTKYLSENEYNEIINQISNLNLIENQDYMYPYRLKEKKNFGDIDVILFDTDKFINLFEKKNKIKEIKKISLFEERFGLYSKHILTENLVQIDLLKSYNKKSMEITRAYYSYSFANIFLKRLTNIVDRNLKFSYLGILCSSNKYVLPADIKHIQIDNNTRLIIDCEYIFTLLDLDYNLYKIGFENEFELLNYFS